MEKSEQFLVQSDNKLTHFIQFNNNKKISEMCFHDIHELLVHLYVLKQNKVV